jgi:hypothetical protein
LFHYLSFLDSLPSLDKFHSFLPNYSDTANFNTNRKYFDHSSSFSSYQSDLAYITSPFADDPLKEYLHVRGYKKNEHLVSSHDTLCSLVVPNSLQFSDYELALTREMWNESVLFVLSPSLSAWPIISLLIYNFVLEKRKVDKALCVFLSKAEAKQMYDFYCTNFKCLFSSISDAERYDEVMLLNEETVVLNLKNTLENSKCIITDIQSLEHIILQDNRAIIHCLTLLITQHQFGKTPRFELQSYSEFPPTIQKLIQLLNGHPNRLKLRQIVVTYNPPKTIATLSEFMKHNALHGIVTYSQYDGNHISYLINERVVVPLTEPHCDLLELLRQHCATLLEELKKLNLVPVSQTISTLSSTDTKSLLNQFMQQSRELNNRKNKAELARSLKLLLCVHTLCKSQEALIDGGVMACFEVFLKSLQCSKYGKHLTEDLQGPYDLMAQAVQEVEAGLFLSHPKMTYLVNLLERNSTTNITHAFVVVVVENPCVAFELVEYLQQSLRQFSCVLVDHKLPLENQFGRSQREKKQ